MKQPTIFRRSACLALALILTVSTSACGAASQPTAKIEPPAVSTADTPNITLTDGVQGKKSETVYVTLDATGAPQQVIVSDWLHSDQANAALWDPADLDGLTPLKGGSLAQQADGKALWQLQGNDLYYSGQSSQPLPLNVTITYRMDGKQASPSELAGKSGKLEMTIDLQNNLQQTVSVNGQDVVMSAPLTVIMGVILPEDVFHNAKVSDGGTMGSDGNRQIAAILAMPGMQKSLGLDGYDIPGLSDLNFPDQFTITADVTDFAMEPIAIACTTGFPDIEIDDQKISDMQQDLTDLQGMQSDLEAMDSDRTIRSLLTDPWMTTGAQTMVKDIFDFYDMDQALLDLLPDYVTKKNIDLIERLRDDADDMKLDQIIHSGDMDALIKAADKLQVKNLQELMWEMGTLKALAEDYGQLLQSKETSALLHQAAGLSETVLQKYPRETAALLAISNLMTPEELQKLMRLYQQSGLADLTPEQLNRLAALYQIAEQSGLTSLSDEQLVQVQALLSQLDLTNPTTIQTLHGLLQFYSASGLKDLAKENPAFLATALTSLQQGMSEVVQNTTGKPFTEEEWNAMIQTGLQAVFMSRTGVTGSAGNPPAANAETPQQNPDAGVSAPDTSGSTEPNLPETSFPDPSSSAQPSPQPSTGEDSTAGESSSQASSAQPSGQESSEQTNVPQADNTLPASESQSASSTVLATVCASGNAASLHTSPGIALNKQTLTAKETPPAVSACTATAGSNLPSLQLLGVSQAEDGNSSGQSSSQTGLNTDALMQLLGEVSRIKQQADQVLTQAQVTPQQLMTAVEALKLQLNGTLTAAQTLATKDPQAYAQLNQAMAQLSSGSLDAPLARLQLCLAKNQTNLSVLAKLCEQCDLDTIFQALSGAKDMQDDLEDAYDLLKSLDRKLNDTELNKSLHAAPQTVATLLQMRDDLMEYKKVSEAMRVTVNQKNIDTFRKMINTLDRLEQEGAVDGYLGQVEDIQQLLKRKDAYVQLAKQYSTFTGAPEGFDTELKFVMKTDSVKVPEADPETKEASAQVQESSSGIKGFFQKLFGSN